VDAYILILDSVKVTIISSDLFLTRQKIEGCGGYVTSRST